MEDKQIGEEINKLLGSEEITEILKEIGAESKSVGRVSEVIGDIYTYMFVHRDSNGINEYIRNIDKLYKEYKGDSKEMAYARSKLLSESIAKKLGIDRNDTSSQSQEKIKEYFLQNYVEKGFVAHSFNGSAKQSITENGFSSSKRVWDNQEVLNIAKIFTDKGVIAPVGGYSHYSGKGIYVEHDFKKCFWHSVGGPEWFKWFTSANHNDNSTKIEDSPYYLKDYEACKQNVIDLCSNSNVSEKERESVQKFYDKLWTSLGKEDTYTALIPKKVIGKSIADKASISGKNAIETIIHVLNDGNKEYVEHGGNCFEGNIPIDSVVITKMPNAKEIFGDRIYNRETKEQLFDKEAVSKLKERVERGKQVKNVLQSGIEATKESVRTGEIQYQTKTINEVHRDRQMGEYSHEKTIN